ncbi:hypothetical protein ACFV2Q_00085 [Streptomyces sp. NPDC059650]|uniref:hypothetical protein n=1 Tax=Streptomyces sp. NPDC059650 TaxID=3346896 RepID=UPI0036A159A8
MTTTAEPAAHGPGRGRLEAAQVWTATLTGLAALGISLFNLAELQQAPKVSVALPHLVRIEPRAPQHTVHLFVQPTITTRFRAEDVEVITAVRLQLKAAAPKGGRPRFRWNESGAWNYDFASNRLKYDRTADPSPLVVTQDKPQQPTLLFDSSDWTLRAGRYDGALVLERASSRTPITRPFCLLITPEALRTFRAAPEREFYELRNDNDTPSPTAPRPSCYTF